MNWNIITIVVFSICGAVSLIFLCIGFIKKLLIKRKYKKKLGYNALSTSQAVNVLRSKAKKLDELGQIPFSLNNAYQELNRDSSVKYVRKLNKLLRKYKKGKRFYQKHKDLNNVYSLDINNKISKFKR